MPKIEERQKRGREIAEIQNQLNGKEVRIVENSEELLLEESVRRSHVKLSAFCPTFRESMLVFASLLDLPKVSRSYRHADKDSLRHHIDTWPYIVGSPHRRQANQFCLSACPARESKDDHPYRESIGRLNLCLNRYRRIGVMVADSRVISLNLFVSSITSYPPLF
jgi:hypothetical protein